MTSAKTSKLDEARLLYEEGSFDPTIAKHLGMTIRAFNELVDSNVAFAEWVEMGRTLCMSFWYEQARIGIHKKGFNFSTWALTMKNQFGWADKMEAKLEELKDMDANQIKDKIVAHVKKNPELASRFAKVINE